MAARERSTLWSRLLMALGLRARDGEAAARAAAAEAHDRATRDRAKQDWNDRRGPPIVGG